jgi:hypothetical protein
MKNYPPKVIEANDEKYISRDYLRNLLIMYRTRLRRKLDLLDNQFQTTDMDKQSYFTQRAIIVSEINLNGLYTKYVRKIENNK